MKLTKAEERGQVYAQEVCAHVYNKYCMERLVGAFPLDPEEALQIIKDEGGAAAAIFDHCPQCRHHPIMIDRKALSGDHTYLHDTVLHEVAHAMHWEALSGIDQDCYMSRNEREWHDSQWKAIYLKLVKEVKPW